MNILFFATAFNGLCQRVYQELSLLNHQISIELSDDENVMLDVFCDIQPDLIICPFLKHRIPDSVWKRVPCLVLHPGVAGDRGPSSLDWAIYGQYKYWGATLLEANHDFDAGHVWSTSSFLMRMTTKASIYRHEITSVASKMIVDVVTQYETDKKRPDIHWGKKLMAAEEQWQPLMKQSLRQISWETESSESILNKINAADSFPGVLDSIGEHRVFLYGAKIEKMDASMHTPGDVIGHNDEAICRATIDGGIWIRQLRVKSSEENQYFKLPAMRVLKTQLNHTQLIPHLHSNVQNDIRVVTEDHVCYIYFDFYNGAFNTEQCKQLLNCFSIQASHADVKVITLMGGEDFWSNGINLNCIEHAKEPALESWRNINAMNDLVEAIIKCQSVLTVSAVRNNAGAGGAVLALAADYVVAREGIVLNPHYQNMGLSGSEFWTYLLPQRVGSKLTKKIIKQCNPMLAGEALNINMVDEVFSETWPDYHLELKNYCIALTESEAFSDLIGRKKQLRSPKEFDQRISTHRISELNKMHEIFYDQSSSYHQLRRNFVYKIKQENGIKNKKVTEERSFDYSVGF